MIDFELTVTEFYFLLYKVNSIAESRALVAYRKINADAPDLDVPLLPPYDSVKNDSETIPNGFLPKINWLENGETELEQVEKTDGKIELTGEYL